MEPMQLPSGLLILTQQDEHAAAVRLRPGRKFGRARPSISARG